MFEVIYLQIVLNLKWALFPATVTYYTYTGCSCSMLFLFSLVAVATVASRIDFHPCEDYARFKCNWWRYNITIQTSSLCDDDLMKMCPWSFL